MGCYIATYDMAGNLTANYGKFPGTLEDAYDAVRTEFNLHDRLRGLKTIVWEEDELIDGKVPDRIPSFFPEDVDGK